MTSDELQHFLADLDELDLHLGKDDFDSATWLSRVVAVFRAAVYAEDWPTDSVDYRDTPGNERFPSWRSMSLDPADGVVWQHLVQRACLVRPGVERRARAMKGSGHPRESWYLRAARRYRDELPTRLEALHHESRQRKGLPVIPFPQDAREIYELTHHLYVLRDYWGNHSYMRVAEALRSAAELHDDPFARQSYSPSDDLTYWFLRVALFEPHSPNPENRQLHVESRLPGKDVLDTATELLDQLRVRSLWAKNPITFPF